MNANESDVVKNYVKTLTDRMAKASQAINCLNFGVARDILNEPIPELHISLDPGLGDDHTSMSIFNEDGSLVATEIVPAPSAKTSRSGAKKSMVSALNYPYSSAEFMEAWTRLLGNKEWRKKEVSKLQYNLNRLAKYPEEFCIILMEEAYNNNWNGVVFDGTPAKYERWLASNNSPLIHIGNGTPSSPKPNSKVYAAAEQTAKAFEQIDTLFNKTHIDDEQ